MRTRFPRPSRVDQLRVRGLSVQLGATLRRAREALGLSQEVTANAAGTWQRRVSALERGDLRALTVEQLLRVADRLDLVIDFIPRHDPARTYREEREAARERQRAPQLDLIGEARAEYERATARRTA